MANRGGGTGYLYLAQGSRLVAEPDSDDLEEQELILLDWDEIEQAIEHGSFNVITWTACIALALLHLQKDKP
jgi:Mlc titration factor MtfA (ptsG expression regulator)